jgi:o-succinylbenzoate---CoA ligase
MTLGNDDENIFYRTSVKKNEKVAIIAKNSLEYAEAINLCWKMGLIAVPLNIHFPQQKIDAILSENDCSYVLMGKDIVLRLKKDCKIFFIHELFQRQKGHRLRLSNKNISKYLENDANIIYTSGSSSSPKAVLHCIGNHYYSALGANRNMPINESSVYLVALPFYHISGFSIIMRTILSGSYISVKIPGFSIAESAKEVNATHISLVPSQLSEMMDDQKSIRVLQNMQAVLLGGARVSDALMEECFYHKINIFRTYGLTEMSSQVCTTSDHDSLAHLKTSGKVLRHRQLSIAKDHEVLVRGKTLFKGYLKNNKLQSTPASDWFHTKDIGFIDHEGYLHVTGRMDAMFTYKGINIYPEELERHINSFTCIIDSLVIDLDVGKEDPVIVAFIKTSGVFDKRVFLTFLRARIEKQKMPRYFLDWPKEDGLKPDRNRFRQMAKKIISKDTGNNLIFQ